MADTPQNQPAQFDPNAPYQPAQTQQTQAGPTAGDSGSAPAFDPNAAYQPASQAKPAASQPPAPTGMAARFPAYADLGQGVIKGAKETARGLGDAANWVSRLLGGQDEQQSQGTPFKNEDLEAKNPVQSAGKVMEGVTEFILGDEALKGLSLVEKAKHLGDVGKILEKSPKIAKAVEIGANALRQGTVSGAQTLAHGGSASDAAGSALLVGGTGAVLEGAGQGVKAVKNFISRTGQAEQIGQDLVKGLTEGATPQQVAQTVAQNLDATETKMYADYDVGMKKISAQGVAVPVKIADSPLQQTAKDLLSDSGLPQSVAENLKGVIPDSDKLEPFLTQLSDSKEIFSWDEMEATRQKIGETVRKLPYDSPIRPDLIKLRSSIDETLENAATDANNPALSDQIKSLRGQYAQTKNLLEERAIETLRDKNPNAIADVLLNKQSVHNVSTLRRLIGPENMKAVEGSILDKMIQDSSKNGVLQGRQVFRKFNSLGPDAKRVIWGERLPQVEQFMKLAGSLPNQILDKIVGHYAPYAIGGAALYQAGQGNYSGAVKEVATGVALAAILKNPAVLEYAIKGISAVRKGAVPAISSAMSEGAGEGENQSEPTPERWIHIVDGENQHYEIHPEDLQEARRRDPTLQIVKSQE